MYLLLRTQKDLEIQDNLTRDSLQTRKAAIFSTHNVQRCEFYFPDLLKTKEESCQFETNELRSKCDSLRMEIVNLSKKIDRLSEEKNQYRAQVQDMNVALKNSLEHIKRLRTQTSSLEEFGQEFEQNVEVLEDSNQEAIKNKPNLTNLTNCLSTLKYEMAILQKKLAPSTSNSPVRSNKMHYTSSEFTKAATESLVVIDQN